MSNEQAPQPKSVTTDPASLPPKMVLLKDAHSLKQYHRGIISVHMLLTAAGTWIRESLEIYLTHHFRQGCQLVCLSYELLQMASLSGSGHHRGEAIRTAALAMDRFKYAIAHKPLLDVDIIPELVLRYSMGLHLIVTELRPNITEGLAISWASLHMDRELQLITSDHPKETNIDILIFEVLAQRMLELWLIYVELHPESAYQEMILNKASEWETYQWHYHNH